MIISAPFIAETAGYEVITLVYDPNGKEIARLRMPSTGAGVTQIEIFAGLGVRRSAESWTVPKDHPTLDIRGLAAGVYSANIIANGERRSTRFVKQ